jgi:lipopolysaccharide transport system permease protein
MASLSDTARLAGNRANRRTEIRPSLGFFDLELSGVWRYRELLLFLVWREIKVRYKQAALGAAWAILQPVLVVLILSTIFGVFARFPSEGVPYPVFLFSALIPWTYFSEALRRSSVGLVGDSELVKKVYFPRLIIPLAMVIAPLVDLVLASGVLFVFLAYYDIWPTWSILALPVLALVSLALSLSIGLWLGPINVRYRDVMHTLPFLLQVWMYATPVIYPLSMVPERWQSLYRLNPMVGIIEGFRWSLLGKGDVDVAAIGVSLAIIVVVLVGGLVFFRRMEGTFADVI